MYLQKINEMLENMVSHDLTANSLARLVALRIFTEEQPESVSIGWLKNSAQVDLIGSYGMSLDQLGKWQSLPMSLEIPLTHSIRQNEVVIIKNTESNLSSFPVLATLGNIGFEWTTLVTFPLNRLGGCGIFTKKALSESAAYSEYLKVLGSIMALYLESDKGFGRSLGQSKNTGKKTNSLSTRQELI